MITFLLRQNDDGSRPLIFLGAICGVGIFMMVVFWLSSVSPRLPQQEPSSMISSKYPDTIQYWEKEIYQYARRYQLDPDLVAALVLQESGGDPRAYSKSGAVGLMQVMPNDGLAANFQCEFGPCFSGRPSMDELYDPVFNIDYGCSMLSGMLYRYGDIRDALKAYGPSGIGYEYADIVLTIYENYR